MVTSVQRLLQRLLPGVSPACLLSSTQADDLAVGRQVHRAGEDTWYQVQDLHVTDILPQMVALSETYLQVK